MSNDKRKLMFQHSSFIYKSLLLTAFTGCVLAACMSKPAVQLRWDAQAHSVYHFASENFPQEMDIDVGAMLATPALLQAKISELKSLPLDPPSFPIQLDMEPEAHGQISVLAKNIRVEYPSPASDDDEQLRREMQEATVGLVQLNTIINQYGVNQNHFIKPLQNNLVNMMFRVPDYPVTVGEHWQIPVVLSSLNTPFLADRAHRDNKVWIKSISNDPVAGRVAEIVYLLQEKISGKRQHFTTEPATPFEVSATYFAVGEYQIEGHKWLSYIGRLDTTVESFRTVSLIALAPVDASNRDPK